jgi:hypothetical protein
MFVFSIIDINGDYTTSNMTNMSILYLNNSTLSVNQDLPAKDDFLKNLTMKVFFSPFVNLTLNPTSCL